jgi:hypothetical protein
VQYTITEVQGIFDLNNKVSWPQRNGSASICCTTLASMRSRAIAARFSKGEHQLIDVAPVASQCMSTLHLQRCCQQLSFTRNTLTAHLNTPCMWVMHRRHCCVVLLPDLSPVPWALSLR